MTVTNVGTQTWTALGRGRYMLGVYFGGDSDAVGAWAKKPVKVALTRNVAPGKSFTFTVRIAAPGAAGNYFLRHRLLKEVGPWFETMERIAVGIVR